MNFDINYSKRKYFGVKDSINPFRCEKCVACKMKKQHTYSIHSASNLIPWLTYWSRIMSVHHWSVSVLKKSGNAARPSGHTCVNKRSSHFFLSNQNDLYFFKIQKIPWKKCFFIDVEATLAYCSPFLTSPDLAPQNQELPHWHKLSAI